MDGYEFKRTFIALIEATENPLAPIIVQNVSDGIDKLGKLMTDAGAKPSEVEAYMDCLCSAWNEPGQIEEISGKPEFVMALAGMLKEAIVCWVRETNGKG